MVGIGSRLIADRIAGWYYKSLKKYSRGDLLDLGCGRAPLYGVYRCLSNSVTCVDWSASPHDICHADRLCNLEDPLPFPDSSFDTIILSDVLEHIFRPSQLIWEIRRLLRRDGKLLMNVPFMYWLHEEPHDYYRYTKHSLRRMADESHLTVIELQELGGCTEVFADLIGKLFAKRRLIGRPVSRFAQACCGWWVKTKLGRRISKATAGKFPLGYVMVAEAAESQSSTSPG